MKKQSDIIKEDNHGHRFEIKNESGQFLFKSVSFSNKNEVMAVLKDLQSFDIASFVIERKTDYEGKFHFQLKNVDSLVIGNSGLFDSRAGMENGIKHLKKRITELALGSGNL